MTKKHKKEVILVIEDETDVRDFASRVLELEGYHVLQAEDGDGGIGIMLENPVALVLLDLHLPERDGWSVLVEMKNKPVLAIIPVVVFTASAGLPQRERALGMGAIDYLVKPLSAASLRKTVARILHHER